MFPCEFCRVLKNLFAEHIRTAGSLVRYILTEAVVQICSKKKGVFRNFVKFTGKHLRQSLFFNNVAGLSLATLLKKKL